MNEATRSVGIGIVGLGTVGGGVVRLIQKHHDDYVAAYGADLRIVRACALEQSRAEELGIGAEAFTTDWHDVVSDPAVDIVIELIGGEHPATEIFESAFAAGKHVVTANKALLGRHVEALGAKAAAAGVQIRCEAAAGGSDVVVGSRYVKGVNVVNWPMKRVLMSYYASAYVRFVTGMPVRDATAGFVCYSAKLLRTMDMDAVRMKGYGFQVEMKYTAWKLGFRVKEVPIIFTERTLGASKMSGGIFREAFFGVLKLRFRSIKPKAV